MIFRISPETIEGQVFYKFAMIEIDGFDKDNKPIKIPDWFTIPAPRVILMGVDGDHDIVNFPVRSQYDRFLECAEYEAEDFFHLVARNLDLAQKCIAVTIDSQKEEDKEKPKTGYETLYDYVKNNKDPKALTKAVTAGDYFKAEKTEKV